MKTKDQKINYIDTNSNNMGKIKRYDVVVIGSGFGGAITACRLAQAGRSVCIIEKGKRWSRFDFPRGPGAVSHSAIADEKHPHSGNGFIEYRTFKNMDVIQGTGVGGGSLHYFNVHIRPPAFIFDMPAWPKGINLRRLRPYYDLTSNMLGAHKIRPTTHRDIPLRTQVFEDAVDSLGLKSERVPICVRLEDQITGTEVKSGCDHCGNCLLGCHVHAKNTLDLNYIPLAEQHGAVVLPQHEALNITPDAQGYAVTCRDLSSPPADSASTTLRTFYAQKVVVAAGTLGTNELLLRCKQRSKTLPRLSAQLGQCFSGNGDFLLAGTHFKNRIVEPGRGPSITSGVSFRKQKDQYIFIEDLGFPDPFIWYFNNVIPTVGRFKRALRQTKRYLGEALGKNINFQMEELLEAGFMTSFLPYLGMGTDAADGTLNLNKQGNIQLHWSIYNSLPMFKEMIKHMKALSEASGGRFINSLLWKTPLLGFPLHKTLTAHPLGGCAMSDSPLTGVTNDCGEVWGYKGLYVADGALMPAAIGVNPSATISAVAERVAFQMIHQRDLKTNDTKSPCNVVCSLQSDETNKTINETQHKESIS
ncbi:MAG: cholesterol oxidase [Pseudohongiellaceae bacterium]|jgi:cholesterol oxidase